MIGNFDSVEPLNEFTFLFRYIVISKIFATFISESFPEISTNFSESFLKDLIKIAIKFYLRIAEILVIVYQ